MSDTPIFDQLLLEYDEIALTSLTRRAMSDATVEDPQPDVPDIDTGDPSAADNEPEYVDLQDPGIGDITINDEFIAAPYSDVQGEPDIETTDPLGGAE